jgi:hypothetical protein
MNDAMNKLLDVIARDFAEWRARGEYGSPSDYSEFLNNLDIEEGRKYLKVTSKQGSQTLVWGFIVKGDNDKLFRKGDILKAAGWAAPARNKARGNILQGDFSWCRWTGPEYL